MSSNEPRKSVGIIIPTNRTWAWHQQVISELQNDYRVDIYTNSSAPQYPLPLRLWMFAEAAILGTRSLANLVNVSAPPWPQSNMAHYALVLNLSERPLASASGSPIIEVHFGHKPDSLSLFSTLIAGQCPNLSIHLSGEKDAIAASYLSVPDKTSLLQSLDASFARLTALVERAVRYFFQGFRPTMCATPGTEHAIVLIPQLLLFASKFVLNKAFLRAFRRLRREQHWSVSIFWTDHFDISRNLPQQKFHRLADDGLRLYADPFLFSENGQTWLFVEDFEYQKAKGVISCTTISEGKPIDPPSQILERDYHMSYPFVFRHQNEIYMMPETGGSRNVELFRARSFPFVWELNKILLREIELYDATLACFENRWWIFAAAPNRAGLAEDELVIFHSTELEGPWHPHLLNPVKSDCRSARPAGRMVISEGRLFRPAQDCEHGYGTGLVWLEIEELTPSSFREREIVRWSGTALKSDGIHTFNREGRVGVIDVRNSTWNTSFAN